MGNLVKLNMMRGGLIALAITLAIGASVLTHTGASTSAAAAAGGGALALVERAIAGPAGPDDEGQYRLIDPIGPGGASMTSATDEVLASTMIGGLYTRWRPYHDPFSSGDYGRRIFPEFRQ
jgi:hypothetical protein